MSEPAPPKEFHLMCALCGKSVTLPIDGEFMDIRPATGWSLNPTRCPDHDDDEPSTA